MHLNNFLPGFGWLISDPGNINKSTLTEDELSSSKSINFYLTLDE